MTLLPHSSLQPGLTNAEGMALNQSPEGAVASYYSESKGFDYNNPSRNQGGKVRGKIVQFCSTFLNSQRAVLPLTMFKHTSRALY